MLIFAVMPFMSIYHLPHGQYGYKGHVINLPQDITTFVSRLPRLPSQLDILLVRKEGSDSTHCDFRVRKLVILRALKWLKQHNKFYRNIEINQDALDQLPDRGVIPGGGWGAVAPPNFWPTTLYSGFSHTTDRKVPSEVVLICHL